VPHKIYGTILTAVIGVLAAALIPALQEMNDKLVAEQGPSYRLEEVVLLF
jgi:hypothetical protein